MIRAPARPRLRWMPTRLSLDVALGGTPVPNLNKWSQRTSEAIEGDRKSIPLDLGGVEGGKATYGLAHMVGSKGLLWAE